MRQPSSESAWRGHRRTASSTFGRSASGTSLIRIVSESSSSTRNTSGAHLTHVAFASHRAVSTSTFIFAPPGARGFGVASVGIDSMIPEILRSEIATRQESWE